MKNIIYFIVICIVLITGLSVAQNITNTLGTSGMFNISDGSTTFLSLSQSSGNFSLFRNMELGGIQNSTSTIGVITKGGVRFIHNYFAPGTDGNNTFVGINSGNFAMSAVYSDDASQNTGVGYNTLNSLTTGRRNSAFGSSSLMSNTTGEANTAQGFEALYSNTAGFGNTANGRGALYLNTTGSFNTSLGGGAGSTITTGSNLICIGFQSEPTSGTAIGQITLGNSSITILRCNTQTITALSDVRDKKNIRDLNLGIDFLMKLKPRQFNWDKRDWYENGTSDGSKMQETPTAGFIAQEFDEVQNSEHAEWLNLVLKDNPDKWEATYGNLLPVMVKAIQELKAEKDKEIAKLTEENILLRTEVENLKLTHQQLAEIELLKEQLIEQIKLLKARDEDEKLKFSSNDD